MAFWVRLAGPQDLIEGERLCRDGFQFTEEEHRARSAQWARLLADDAALAWVVEDLSAGQNRLYGFGIAFGVVEEFVREFLARPTSWWGHHLFTCIQEGKQVVLNRKQLYAGHHGEGIVLTRFWGWRTDLSYHQQIAVQWLLRRGYLVLHEGYHLSMLIQEAFGQHECEWLANFGHTVYDQYLRPVGRGQAAQDAPEVYALVTTTRAEALQRPTFPVWALFAPKAPPIKLCPQPLRVIRLASMFGFSNAEIAELLDIAVPTVGAHWKAIYGAIREAGLAPLVFGKDLLSNFAQHREQELRRHCIQYIRRLPSIMCPNLIGSLSWRMKAESLGRSYQYFLL